MTIAKRPSYRDGMARDMPCFALLEKRIIFYFWACHDFGQYEVICPSGNITTVVHVKSTASVRVPRAKRD